MTGESSKVKQRTDLTGVSPAPPFAARAATVRHSRHEQEQIYAPTLALVFATTNRSVVLASLLQELRCVERNEIYTPCLGLRLACGPHFSVVVLIKEVTSCYIRKVLFAKHQ